MGFFDSIKKAVGGAQQASTLGHAKTEPQVAIPQSPPATRPAVDTAGFEWDRDEEGFFNAVLHMESEGEMGGTDQSRAEIAHKYGIRDRSHWQDVKAAVYHMLTRKYGSVEAVMQREMNWRSGETQKRMQAKTAQVASSGALAPVEGVSLETWAAINASIIGGANFEDLLRGAGIEVDRWNRAKTEWEGRMAKDTTFAIATAYGNAFQNASKGKYAEYAKEANAARAANREMTMQPPMSLEQYYEIMYEQSAADAQGKDPTSALKAMGLSVIDFVDLSTFMGYHFHRTAMIKRPEYEAAHERVSAKMKAKYPGLKLPGIKV